LPAYAEPRAARLFVPAAKHIWSVAPPVCVLCWARMKLIAIGREYERIFRVLPDGQDDQAHA